MQHKLKLVLKLMSQIQVKNKQLSNILKVIFNSCYHYVEYSLYTISHVSKREMRKKIQKK